MYNPGYIDELSWSLDLEDKTIQISDSVSRGLFSVMTPREIGKHFDILFHDKIINAGMRHGKLINWNIRPFVLGLGYTDDWNNWNGIRVFGTYEFLGNK